MRGHTLALQHERATTLRQLADGTERLRARAILYLAAPAPPFVLVVEDTRETANMICAWLRASGLDADHVPTIAGARHRLAKGGVGAVVIDQGLPDGDGWTLAAEIAHPIAVALMSGKIDPVQLERLRVDTRANAIVDPSEPHALVAEVRRLIDERRKSPKHMEIP